MTLISPPRPSAPPVRRWIDTGAHAREEAVRYLAMGEDPPRASAPGQVHATFPVILDDLASTPVTARLAHHGARDVQKLGRLRTDGNAAPEEIAHLATLSDARHALLAHLSRGAAAALHYGDALSRRERERATRRFIRELAGHPDAARVALFADANVPDADAGWMAEEAHARRGSDDKLSARMRREGLACLPLPRALLSHGIGFLLDEALRKDGHALEGARVAIHGNGALGQAIATSLLERGARVVAITGPQGTSYWPAGLEAALLGSLHATRPVRGTPGLTLPSSAILSVPCEALVLTAPLPHIGPDLARRIGARLVYEAEDGALSPAADVLLLRYRARTIPDLLGGLPSEALADLQWEQYVHDERWSRGELASRLERKLRDSYARVEALAHELATTPRRAAHIAALAGHDPRIGGV